MVKKTRSWDWNMFTWCQFKYGLRYTEYSRSTWERGGGAGYVKYIINISKYITGITINQINYVMIL